MGVEFHENKIVLEGMVGEDQVTAIRDHLNGMAPQAIEADFSNCNDIHMAALQQFLAYQTLHEVTYFFGDNAPFYKKAIDGFRHL